MDRKVWYLPHHRVYHPKKGKLRVVFDCGASFCGKALNAELLKGPDLTNSLIDVLNRFRQEPIGLMADITAMFHQVKVSDSDADFLRFLWWPDGDISQPPLEHRMTVHLFGATSSPSCASYALSRTAKDNREHFRPEVTDTVLQNFYVDDLLKSVPTRQCNSSPTSHRCHQRRDSRPYFVKWKQSQTVGPSQQLPLTLKTCIPSHQMISYCSRQSQLSHQEHLIRLTFTPDDAGGRFNTWPTSSGDVGH